MKRYLLLALCCVLNATTTVFAVETGEPTSEQSKSVHNQFEPTPPDFVKKKFFSFLGSLRNATLESTQGKEAAMRLFAQLTARENPVINDLILEATHKLSHLMRRPLMRRARKEKLVLLELDKLRLALEALGKPEDATPAEFTQALYRALVPVVGDKMRSVVKYTAMGVSTLAALYLFYRLKRAKPQEWLLYRLLKKTVENMEEAEDPANPGNVKIIAQAVNQLTKPLPVRAQQTLFQRAVGETVASMEAPANPGSNFSQLIGAVNEIRGPEAVQPSLFRRTVEKVTQSMEAPADPNSNFSKLMTAVSLLTSDQESLLKNLVGVIVKKLEDDDDDGDDTPTKKIADALEHLSQSGVNIQDPSLLQALVAQVIIKLQVDPAAAAAATGPDKVDRLIGLLENMGTSGTVLNSVARWWTKT